MAIAVVANIDGALSFVERVLGSQNQATTTATAPGTTTFRTVATTTVATEVTSSTVTTSTTISSSTAASSTLPSVSTGPISLINLETTEERSVDSTDAVTMNGTLRTDAISFKLGCYEPPQEHTYTLSRKYRTFTVIVGQADDSNEEDQLEFEVLVDGERAALAVITKVGEEKQLTADLAAGRDRGFRLTIRAKGYVNCGAKQRAVWASPTLIP
ncbi:NPCBM/NEW2 domain protein [Actinokineospora sp. UTMC 2448]|nr:NPCBM/NEW2 domain protein [Actinokineospora sp. UTMC 2448]